MGLGSECSDMHESNHFAGGGGGGEGMARALICGYAMTGF